MRFTGRPGLDQHLRLKPTDRSESDGSWSSVVAMKQMAACVVLVVMTLAVGCSDGDTVTAEDSEELEAALERIEELEAQRQDIDAAVSDLHDGCKQIEVLLAAKSVDAEAAK